MLNDKKTGSLSFQIGITVVFHFVLEVLVGVVR